VTDYNIYLTAKSDFEKMQMVYKLYLAQKIARETWGKTLWVNLNTQALTDGIDNFIKDFRKLSKPIREMTVAGVLEKIMKQFKNVVPLMASLKHEALRERHWRLLMTKTGKLFDMSPERFTLDNMFAMELHKFQEVVEEIVLNANKELGIERGVKEIADQWETIKFTVIKHTIGDNVERRYEYLSIIEKISHIVPFTALFSVQWMKLCSYWRTTP
jgi:dynein heavy chain, axonemal